MRTHEVRWCVVFGPSPSHLNRAEWHDLKSKALARYHHIKETSFCIVERHEWHDHHKPQKVKLVCTSF